MARPPSAEPELERRSNLTSRPGKSVRAGDAWHLISAEYPPLRGGVSDYTELVAEGLAERGEEVHVWCPAIPGATETRGRAQVHPELGALSRADLRRADVALDAFPGPRHLLVQWVPHSYGYRSLNLGFCLWLRRRARRHGDRVELMVHEPFLDLRAGRSAKHLAAAVVHRLMTAVLLSGATKVWAAAPLWAELWRPYALGRSIGFEWLPIPSNVDRYEGGAGDPSLRNRFSAGGAVLGHFGTYGPDVSGFLEQTVPRLLEADPGRAMVLVGRGGETFRQRLIQLHPDLAPRIHATGGLHSSEVGRYLAAMDLMVQPYPGGVNSRRGSLMAALQHGRPILTLEGSLTEPLWRETGSLALVETEDPLAFVQAAERLLADPGALRALGAAASALYEERFDLRRTLDTLQRARRAQPPA